MALVLNGRLLANEVLSSLAIQLVRVKKQVTPTLATVQVGDRKDSATYLRLKRVAAESIGIAVKHVSLPSQVREAEVLKVIDRLNCDPAIHGLIVQLPLPPHISSFTVSKHISPLKDVDGIHPLNVGLLSMKGGDPYFVPCTPLGILAILDRMEVPIAGKRAIVIGRSGIVGTPTGMLLNRRDATVTVCHRHTPGLDRIVKEGDIVVSAAGDHRLVRGSWIKPGAAVIDVGTNPVEDPTRKAGYRLDGDVCFDEVKGVAGYITPVPGGVGPMTVAMLMKNTAHAALRQLSLSSHERAMHRHEWTHEGDHVRVGTHSSHQHHATAEGDLNGAMGPSGTPEVFRAHTSTGVFGETKGVVVPLSEAEDLTKEVEAEAMRQDPPWKVCDPCGCHTTETENPHSGGVGAGSPL